MTLPGTIARRKPVCSGLHINEARQNAWGVQNGQTRRHFTAEPENPCAVPRERGLGNPERQSAALPGRGGPPAPVLPLLDDQPALQPAGKLLHPLRGELHLLLHLIRYLFS